MNFPGCRYTYVDGEDNRVLSVAFDKPFWQRGEFDQFPGLDNPWSGRSNAAPFDSGFYLVMNVAVGQSMSLTSLIVA